MTVSEYSEGLQIVSGLGERCTAVPLQVQDSDKTKLEMHGSVRARLMVKNSYQIRREVLNSATAGVLGSDKTKLEVHGSVRARLMVKNSYQIRQEVHSSATAGARQ